MSQHKGVCRRTRVSVTSRWSAVCWLAHTSVLSVSVCWPLNTGKASRFCNVCCAVVFCSSSDTFRVKTIGWSLSRTGVCRNERKCLGIPFIFYNAALFVHCTALHKKSKNKWGKLYCIEYSSESMKKKCACVWWSQRVVSHNNTELQLFTCGCREREKACERALLVVKETDSGATAIMVSIHCVPHSWRKTKQTAHS